MLGHRMLVPVQRVSLVEGHAQQWSQMNPNALLAIANIGFIILK